MKPAHGLALFALGLGVLVGAALRRAPTLPLPTAAPHGVELRDGLVRFVDPARWQAFVRETLPEAERDGVRGPDGVLTYMLRRALPGTEWPPPVDTDAREQWDRMVAAAAVAMTTGELAAPAQVFEVVS